MRLRRSRGRAVGKPCAAPDCTRLATGWGLVGEATNYGESHGKPVRWSTDLDDYAPLCARHNALLDHGGDWTYCARGHVRLTWGTDAHGHCRGCARVRGRERQRRLVEKGNWDARSERRVAAATGSRAADEAAPVAA